MIQRSVSDCAGEWKLERHRSASATEQSLYMTLPQTENRRYFQIFLKMLHVNILWMTVRRYIILKLYLR